MRRESSCGGELRKGLGKATVLAYDLGRGDGRRISDWKGACVPYLSCTERYGTEKKKQWMISRRNLEPFRTALSAPKDPVTGRVQAEFSVGVCRL